jgi:hypothetical protein
MRTEKWVNTPNAGEQTMNSIAAQEVNQGQAFCGRSYNEQSDFAPANYAALQNILDKRNELLSGVKANRLP